jgi:hypothetical protein
MTLTQQEPFAAWIEDVKVEVEKVQEILTERLSDNPHTLYEQLSKAEAWHGRMTSILADANAYLDRAEFRALLPRSEKITDTDRKTHQANAVVNERRIRDIIEGLCKAIDTRLMLGMSLRKQNQGEKSGFQP